MSRQRHRKAKQRPSTPLLDYLEARSPSPPAAEHPTPAAERPPKTCQLLRLPRELRDIVWAYALVEDRPIEVHRQRRPLADSHTRSSDEWWSSTKPPTHEARLFPDEPALARVCRQLRSDTLEIFWTGNTFKLNSTGTIIPALSLARRKERPFLRHVILSFDITYTISGGSGIQQSQQAAQLSVKLNADGTVTFRAMAWLDKECACGLLGEMNKYLRKTRESAVRSGLLCFATDLGSLLRRRYNRKTVRWADTWEKTCEGCGKKVWTD